MNALEVMLAMAMLRVILPVTVLLAIGELAKGHQGQRYGHR